MDNFEAMVKAAEENCFRGENGKIVIQMEVKNAPELFANVSAPGVPLISDDAAEFIKNAAEDFAFEEQFILKIKGDLSQEEKELCREGIRQYFVQSYIAAARELRRNRFKLALLFAVGVFILGASYLFKREIWSEVGNIAAWVLIWRMVDIIAFENRDLVSAKKRFRAFAEAEIEFE